MRDVKTFRELWACANGKPVRQADSKYGHYKSWCGNRGVEPMDEREYYKTEVVGLKLRGYTDNGACVSLIESAECRDNADFVLVGGRWFAVCTLAEWFSLPGGGALGVGEDGTEGEDDNT